VSGQPLTCRRQVLSSLLSAALVSGCDLSNIASTDNSGYGGFASRASVGPTNTIYCFLRAELIFSRPVTIEASRALDLFLGNSNIVGSELTEFLNHGLSVLGGLLGSRIPSPNLELTERTGYNATIKFSTDAVTVDSSDLPIGQPALPQLLNAGQGEYRWTVKVDGDIKFSEIRPDTLDFFAMAPIEVELKGAFGWRKPDLKWEDTRSVEKTIQGAVVNSYPRWLEQRYHRSVRIVTNEQA
jgi:hypothetical protein